MSCSPNKIASLFAALLLAFSLTAKAADWPQWRGPAFNGSSEATNLPDNLDPAKNQLWSTALPGASASTPVLIGDHLLVSTIDTTSKKLLAMCLDRKDGHIVWQKEVGVGFKASDRNNLASPSPVTDGKLAIFYFGTGDLVAFDLKGDQLWARNIQKDHGDFSVEWLYASSPLLYHDKLYVQVLHRSEDSYLLAFDPTSGKELWKQVRPNEAVQESKESYATPVPMEAGGKAEILLVGGDCVTAHDPDTGKELWRCGGWNPAKHPDWRIISGVTVAGDLVVACPPKGGPVFAIKDGGSGDVTASGVAWKNKDVTSDVCVPLFYKNNLCVLEGDRRKLACLDPKTGDKKWATALTGNSVFRASPTGADGKIYCINENADVFIVNADDGKIISKASLGDGPARASIIAGDGTIYVRTSTKVVAFGTK